MSQNEQIIDYIDRHGSITQKEASDALGCMRLGARIYDMKAAGYKIGKTMETRENRFGVLTSYARYYILQKPEICA